MKTSPSSKKSAKGKSELERARESLGRYLGLRDHSLKELGQKLSRRFDQDVVEATLIWAIERDLLLPEDKLSERMSHQLGRKLKSHRQIQGKLRTKGLPGSKEDRELEVEKIRQLLQKRFHFEGKLSYEEKVKAFRYLKYRGFADSLIKQVIHEKP